VSRHEFVSGENALRRLLALPFALCGAALVVAGTSRYGIGVTPDSVGYISIAENLLNGRGYTNFYGDPLLSFPPLYPTVLAALGAIGMDVVLAARWLNAAVFALVVGVATAWIWAHVRTPTIAIFASLAVLFSPPLIGVSLYAWSEALFTFLALLCLAILDRFGHVGENRLRLLLPAAIAGLAWSTRYVGAAVVATGVAWILLQPHAAIAQRLGRVLRFSAVAAAPLGLWFARNLSLSSTAAGARGWSLSTPWTAVGEAMGTMSTWVLPGSIPAPARLAAIGCALLIVGSSFVAVLRSSTYNGAMRVTLPSALLLLFAGIYVGALVASTSMTALDPIDDRYLAPIYAPLVMACAVLLDALLKSARNAAVRLLLVASFGCWLAYPVTTSVRLIDTSLRDGAGGFHTSRWVESPLAGYVASGMLAGHLYANEPYALYMLTRTVAEQSPRKYSYRSSRPTADLEEMGKALTAHNQVYLVWFSGSWDDYLYTPDELGARFQSSEVVMLEDGAVYVLRASTP
jgi:hypothetical protein